ncbi:Histidine-containing phosphotransfer protein 5 [Citrus sinensis]|nr:Histidine-containing phosphotransfer protein 5 [Citrus sinensis]
MVGTSLQQELNNFVRSLREQGILDHNFDTLSRIQNDQSPLFVTEVINLFTRDAENAITQARDSLYFSDLILLQQEPSVDYDKLIAAVHQLRGASSSIGGCRVALACRELRSAIDDKDKERTFKKRAWEANPGTSEGTTPSIESWLGVFAAGGSSAEHLNGCLSYSLC